MKKERQESNPQSCNRADVLGEYARRIKDGEKVGITELLQSVVSGIMKLERDLYLQQVQGGSDAANGFYSRTLQLSIGKLDLKVPRVRHRKERVPAGPPSAKVDEGGQGL